MATTSRVDAMVRQAFLDALRPTVDGPTTNRLGELLRRWDEYRQRGEEIALEDLCRDCPELIEPMRRGLAALSEMDRAMQVAPRESVETPAETVRVDQPIPKASSDTVGTLPDVEPRAGAEPVPGFRLTRVLGSGGFGEVWEAQAPGGFPVAIKFVRLAGNVGESELKSLQLLRRLRHPNLLGTFGAWRSPARLIIAMELADRTLADRLREAKGQELPGIPGPELLEYLRAAAKGIDYLNQPHQLVAGGEPMRVQHRDIKPANILLVGDGIKVADFGLARMLERTIVTHSGGMTPAYAAPEFFAGRTSRYSDQYSLAASYCELRGGRPPFTGTYAEVMLGHVDRPPNLGMLPETERPAVARALAKNPEERWPSCTAFIEALAEAGRRTVPRDPRPGLTPDIQSTLLPPQPAARGLWPRRIWVAGFLAFAAVVGVVWQWPAIQRMLTRADTDTTREKQKFGPEGAHEAQKGSLPAGDGSPKKDDVPYPVERAEKAPNITPPKEKSPVQPSRLGERLRFWKHAPSEVRAAAWVPNTTRVLSADAAGDLLLWDTVDGTEIHRLSGHTRPTPEAKAVQTLAISAEGRTAISGGDDRMPRLWDLDKGREQMLLRKKRLGNDEDFEIYGLGFYDGGRRAISAGNSRVLILWDLMSGAEDGVIKTELGEALCLAVSPDGSRALIGGSRGQVWLRDLSPQGKETRYVGHLDDVLAVAFFADGQQFVSGGGGDGPKRGREDYALRLWKVGDKEPRVLEGHSAKVGCVAVSRDGTRILSGDSTGVMRFWDAETGRELPRFDEAAEDNDRGAVTCVSFSPDGTEAVSGYTDGKLRVWVLPKIGP